MMVILVGWIDRGLQIGEGLVVIHSVSCSRDVQPGWGHGPPALFYNAVLFSTFCAA